LCSVVVLVVVPCSVVVLVLNGVVVVVELGCVVELVDEDVVELGGRSVKPQNCTSEIFGVSPLPTCRPAFENVPESCGGENEVNRKSVPPFTMMPDTPSVDCHVAPDADPPVSVTTFSLPAGFSNTKVWSKLNFAINTEPDGHPVLMFDDVVETRPASERTAPSSMVPTPILADRVLPSEFLAVFTIVVLRVARCLRERCVVPASATQRQGAEIPSPFARDPFPSAHPEPGLSAHP